MPRSRLRVWVVALSLGLTGCQWWYNDVPSPDDLLHLVPWFDAMILQPSIPPYARSDVPRTTVPGTVPVTGGEADWSAEWLVGNTKTADRLVNPLAGSGNPAVGDTLFQTYCAVCHGATGAGNGPVSTQMPVLSLLTDRAKAFSDGYIYSIIRYGRGIMPRYGDKVRGVMRWEIVDHVRRLQAQAGGAN